MSDQVLTDEQRRAAYGLHDDEPNGLSDRLARVERAVVAALAARGGVDVEALAKSSCHDMPCYCEQVTEDEWRQCPECPWHGQWPLVDIVVDALRLALAISEARHAEREAMWLRLRYLEVEYALHLGSDEKHEIESLIRALGLEG